MNGNTINNAHEIITDTIVAGASSAAFVSVGMDILHVIVATATTLAAKEILVYAKRKFFK